MIRFGLRLAVTGGRDAVFRLVIIAVAVALGVGMLLTAVAGINAVRAQNDRYGWANSAALTQDPAVADPLWWDLRVDTYAYREIGRVDLAAGGPRSPVPPGLNRLPAPGEYFASPALAVLLAEAPVGQLGDRYPGRLAGTIGPEALPSPDSLVAVVGYDAAELSQRPGVTRVGTFRTTAATDCPGGCWAGVPTEGLQLILSVVALGLIFPLVILIGTATRLSAARREQRFAAMRLVGATPGQVSMVAAVEAAVSAAIGTAGGFVLFGLFRERLAAVPFTGMPFYPADLTPGVIGTVSVALGVPLVAVLAARVALRRVRISPLGVSRRATPRPPRAYRPIPLAIGAGVLTWFLWHRPETSTGQTMAYVPGFLIVMTGLVVAGPWLTLIAARLVARRANRAETLIAARRLADDPRAGFRAVSGLVLALFVTSVAVGLIGSIVADRDDSARPSASGDSGGASDADRDDSAGPSGADRGDGAGASADEESMFVFFRDEEKAAGASTEMLTALAAVPGVRGAGASYQPPAHMSNPDGGAWAPYLLATCADVARTPGSRSCVAGARTAWVFPDLIGPDEWRGDWPDAGLTPAEVEQLPLEAVRVVTDGTRAAAETARTVIENAHPSLWPPLTDAEREWASARVLEGWKRLADVVIVISLIVAGCALAVSAAGGLSERRRPFAMLRLSGVSLGTLRRVVMLETGTPLLVAAVVAIGTGLLSAHLFLRAQMGLSLRAPDPAYGVMVVAGMVVSLAVIASTMPLLRRVTGPEAARNE